MLLMDILTAFAGFVFAIYGLSRAVEDRDDIIIMIGIFVQIGFPVNLDMASTTQPMNPIWTNIPIIMIMSSLSSTALESP
jgi:hypothetical protein